MPGKIILLNGVSSAGKSTLAKAIQQQAASTFYYMSIDMFIEMAGDKAVEKDTIRTIREAMQNFCAAIAALYQLDRNILVDVVCVKDGFDLLPALIEALHDKSVLLTHVKCSPNELEAREKARGDRDVGLARWQLDHAYTDIPYDIEVDTSTENAERCAEKVLAAFNDDSRWNGFSSLIADHYRAKKSNS